MNTYGYARVSSKDQCEDRQLISLRQFPVQEKNVYIDKMSGKDFERPQYKKLMKRVKPGDLIVVKSIDRLGRNYDEILNQWRVITKEKEVDIVVIDMPLLDTRTNNKTLTKTFISDLVLQILSYVSQKERENIKTRQRQGIDVMPVVDGKKVSLKTGRPTGRPSIKYPAAWEQYYNDWKSGSITATKAMELLGLKRNTFYKLVKQYEEE